MIYEITPSMKQIDFGATGVKEILQNVAMILSSLVYSCPMDRGFAYSPDLDAPISIQIAKNTAAIYAAIQENEPRAEITEVRFEGDGLNGQLKPIVKVRVVDGAV